MHLDTPIMQFCRFFVLHLNNVLAKACVFLCLKLMNFDLLHCKFVSECILDSKLIAVPPITTVIVLSLF